MVEISATYHSLLKEMNRRAAHAASGNIRTLGVVSSAPTVTVDQSSAPTSPYVKYPTGTLSDPSDYDGVCTFVGGWTLMDGSLEGVYVAGATREIGVDTGGSAAGGSSADAYACVSRVIFYTDAPIFSFAVRTSNIVPWRIIVDGQYVDVDGHENTVTTRRYCTVDFSSAGGRKVRRIEIECQGGRPNTGGNNGLISIGPFYKTALDSIWAPSAEEIGPRLMVYGDSYTFGPQYAQVTTSMQGDGWARYLGDLMGLDDVWCSGVSGSGWIAQASGVDYPNALDRVTDITEWSPDALIIALGINDAILDGTTADGQTISTANVQTRVGVVLDEIRASLPSLPIVVMGCFERPGLSEAAGYEAAISAAVTAYDDPRVKFVPMVSEEWQTGTGDSGSTAGDGNADVYIASDGTHPTFEGHAYLAQRALPAVMNAFNEMT